MSTGYSAALLEGWRFSYDDLMEMFDVSFEDDNIAEKQDEIFDKLYDTGCFYADDLYADPDCCTYYLGSMLQENDLHDTDEPITGFTIAWSQRRAEELKNLWESLFPDKPLLRPNIYMFPRIT